MGNKAKKNKKKKALQCLDLETMTIKSVVSIDYSEGRITMHSEQAGYTSNKLRKVKLLTDL